MHNFAEIDALQGKIHNLFLAVKFSNQAFYSDDYIVALAYLDQVEEMFAIIDQKRALGVVYNNRGNILRRKNGNTDHFEEALATLRTAIDNARNCLAVAAEALAEVEKAKEKAAVEGQPSAQGDIELAASSRRTVIPQGSLASASATPQLVHDTLVKVLAGRLMNYGDCLREAKREVDALVALDEAEQLQRSIENIGGMVKVMGNRGLVLMEMLDFDAAFTVFTDASRMAASEFRFKSDDDKTISFLQF
jgi:tetratricopeptide (TPR) repeat protein